ncbi:flippase activity-associated protein Agl23 [Candidatus Chlorohelix sp.]|uniref:flippase activity-associated protein Agl23 n=1 Tax=Candidatus Chlorohelix sp. TaxID=3139201 RepID=UPI00304345A6
MAIDEHNPPYTQTDELPAESAIKSKLESGYSKVRQPSKRFYSSRFGGFGFKLNLEVLLYLIIIIFALFTRFADLDSRALHHDEGVHAYYSYQYYTGGGYEQEPWKHGPLLYHVTAATFWLFGDSVTTARFPAAALGVIMALLPLLIRRELGRWGALSASFLLAISPLFLYYSRFIREDIFVAVISLLLVGFIFRFISKPAPSHFYLLMASLALLFCTKAISFFYLALFGGFLFAWLCWQLAPRLLVIIGIYLLAALASFSFLAGFYRLPPIPTDNPNPDALKTYLYQVLSHPLIWAALILGVIGLILVYYAFREVAVNRRNYFARMGLVNSTYRASTALFMPYEPGTVAYAVGWLGRRWKVVGVGFALAFGIYSAFYTGFFSSPAQGEVGLLSTLFYWMAQQGVERGSQPWYYYMLTLPLYEPLALIFGSVSGIFILWQTVRFGTRRKIRRELIPTPDFSELENDDELDAPVGTVTEAVSRPRWQVRETSSSIKGNSLLPGERQRLPHPYFAPLFLLTWAVGNFFFLSWAGEKMPWLTLHLALPLILLTAYLCQRMFGGIDKYLSGAESRELVIYKFRSVHFFWILTGLLLFIGVLGYTITMNVNVNPAISQPRSSQALLWVPLILSIFLLISGSILLGSRIAFYAMGLVAFGLMSYFTLHTAFAYAYVYADVPQEIGVYTQTSPDVARVVNEINTVANVLPQRYSTPIMYDNETRTPLDFYLRDFTNRKAVKDFSAQSLSSSEIDTLSTYPIIIALTDKRTALEPQLGGRYERYTYSFRAWFGEETYRNFIPVADKEIEFLTGKINQTTVRDNEGQVALTKGEVMNADKLQALSSTKGLLDKLYNGNGGNSWILNTSLLVSGVSKELQGDDFSRLWRYVVFREVVQPIGSLNFDLYISKDILAFYRQYGNLVERPLDRS